MLCALERKHSVDDILFDCQLMQSALPPDWSPKGHLLLSIQTFLFFKYFLPPLHSKCQLE